VHRRIEAVFLDVGDTLRILVEDETVAAQARRQLRALVGAREPLETFLEKVQRRWKAHRKWARANRTDVSERELWTRRLLPDFPPDRIAPLSRTLTRLWRDTDGRRVARPDAKPTLLELGRRGYALGIIANCIAETEIPEWLEAEGLSDHVKAVVVSSSVRYRKPAPEIYWEAARRIGVEPARCAYVGDHPVQDVQGARLAGFALTVRLQDGDGRARRTPRIQADQTIRALSELLDIFPPRVAART
jgi:FMN phosphatase YigB (HAD superfamily)